jgi:hypothetical protein
MICGEGNVDPSEREKIIAAIETAGLIFVPFEVAQSPSSFAGSTWMDVFFQYV